jgi:hypothetical protein
MDLKKDQKQTREIYKVVAVMVQDESDYQKLADKVNELIAQGYMPHGSIAVDHTSPSSGGGHTDVVQPMILDLTEHHYE